MASRVSTAPPPEVRITLTVHGFHPLDLSLSYPLDPQHEQLLRCLHEGGNDKGVLECRMHDDDPRLRDLRQDDGRVHGAWLYLRTNPHAASGTFDLSLCHWPNSIASGSHAVPSPMTPEHRRRQEYVALRGSAAGYDVELEKSLARGTRSDVIVKGSEVLAAEIQQSGLSVSTVMRRDTLAAATGAVPTWFADTKNPPWARRRRVAHIETNERRGMDPGAWTVTTGPRALEHEKCVPGSRIDCPDGRNWCGKYHQIWVPMTGITVDHIVELIPDGGLVRLQTGTRQGTVLVRPQDRDEWISEQPQGDGQNMPRQRDVQGDKRGALRHNDYSSCSLRERILSEEQQPDSTRFCVQCGQRLLLIRPGRVICERCRIKGGAA